MNLPNMGLRRLYPGFIESTRVTCLYIRDNQISQITSGSFDCLSNLQFLDISQNRIATCDLLTFGGHSNLQTLVADENDASGDDTQNIVTADWFPKVEHLYLRKDKLRRLDFSLSRSFPRLAFLYLSDNFMSTMDFIRDPPASLTHLHLERNQFYKFQGEVLRCLHSLFLDGNKINSICNRNCADYDSLKLYGANRLRFLSISRNGLSIVDRDAFLEASGLTTLNLAHNKITNLPYTVFECLSMLEDLSLKDNLLYSLPNFNRNKNLQSLTLSNNRLEHLPSGSFCDLYNLKYLTLSDNMIRSIESGAFSNLDNLLELNLANNRLTLLPKDWLVPQSSLQRLDVRDNDFTSLTQLSLESTQSLTHIYVKNNPIRGELVWAVTPSSKHVPCVCREIRTYCFNWCTSSKSNLIESRPGIWFRA